MKKFLIFLSIIIILGLGVFFTLSYFQANNQTKGTLRFKVHPLESIVKINNKPIIPEVFLILIFLQENKNY